MLTIEEIKKELDAGNTVELECVDRVGAFYGLSPEKTKGKLEGVLRVRDVYHNDIYFDNGDFIEGSELKYFRIKRHAPTFDDLIDVAVRAVKDKVLFTMSIGGSRRKGRYLNYTVSGNSPSESFYENNGCYQSAINFINSLYTETFVIESEEDCNKFKGEVNSLVLANGEDIIDDVMFHRCYPYFTTDMVGTCKLPFKLLKGATVTQKRGEI